MRCLKSPAIAFCSWIQDQHEPQGCDPQKEAKRLNLKELASLEPQQGQHGEHLQHNKDLGGRAHHRFLLRLAFWHQIKGPTAPLG